MRLSDNNNRTLMLALHQKIEEYANYFADKLDKGETTDLLTYPPNFGLTDNEKHALEKLKNDQDLKSSFRKILAGNSPFSVLPITIGFFFSNDVGVYDVADLGLPLNICHAGYGHYNILLHPVLFFY